jgi:hypothetical protein
MKIRLQGKPDEIEAAAEKLKEMFEILEVSAPYKNRGNSGFYRIYLDAELPKTE